ncbi:hypothetical protein FHT86_007696 [Rhizobium sp. BK313]|nr:hypothetical protein [Rhizobium sp. BK313]
MATPFYWNELNTLDFAALSPDTTIADRYNLERTLNGRGQNRM